MNPSIFARSLVVLGILSVTGSAQNETEPLATPPDQTAQSAPTTGHHGRFELYTASTSLGYSSLGNLGTSSIALGSLAADYDVTSSLAAGYSSVGEGGYFSLVYTPSYTRRVRFSRLSAFDQSLALSLRRVIARRGALRMSFNVGDSTVQQLVFLPSTLANAAAANATSGDLVKAILGESQTNVQLDQIFAQQDTGNAAILAALFGGRVFTSTGHLEYDWATSARSQLFASIDASRDQPLDSGAEFGQQVQYNLRSSAGAAAAGWNYSLTPKTTMGFGVDYHRSRSSYFNGDVVDAKYTLGREFRRRWFTTLTGGLGRLSIIPAASGGPARDSMEWLGSGTLGVKGRGQSIIFSGSRSGGDSYGLGADSNTTAGASWNWTPARRTWSLFLDGSYQNLQTAGKTDVAAWATGGGLEKKINHQTTASFSLAYLNSTGQTLLSGQPSLSGYQVRLIIIWRPRPLS